MMNFKTCTNNATTQSTQSNTASESKVFSVCEMSGATSKEEGSGRKQEEDRDNIDDEETKEEAGEE